MNSLEDGSDGSFWIMAYRICGYYILDLKLSNEERPIGKCGRMHRDYLKEYFPMLVDHLVLEGLLWTYLANLNEFSVSAKTNP